MIKSHDVSAEPSARRGSSPRRTLFTALAMVAASVLVVTSAPAAAVAEDVDPTSVVAPASATLAGSLVVGGTVTVEADAWTPAETTVAYEWWSADQAYAAPVEGVDQNPTAALIADATASSLELDSSLVGKYVWAVATGSFEGLTPASVVAASTTAVSPGILNGSDPVLDSDTATVDTPLTVDPGEWPEGTTFTYKWRIVGADNVVVYSKVTAATYAPTASTLGKSLTAVVTATLPGYTTVERVSPTLVVGSAAFVSTVEPSIKGSAYVGATLTAQPGTVTPAANITYQWRRSGAPISGAKSATYKITTADLGKVLSVTVTARRSGYETLTRTASTPTVKRPFTAISAPKISGTLRVGSVIAAKVTAWSPTAAFTYQWRRNGVAIEGATNATYRLTSNDLGASLSVKIVGTRSGYFTRTATSSSTAAILPPATMRTDGLFEVGTTIAPGTYVATGGVNCYFERRSDDNVGVEEGALGWNFFYGGSFGGRKVVTISASDTHFYTQGCGVWNRPATNLVTSVTNGTWIVGKDMRPGIWKAVGPFTAGGCYVAIHGGFSGIYEDDVILDGSVSKVGLELAILSSDKGFTSRGCGTWKKVG